MLDMIDVTNTTESVAADFLPEPMESQNELAEAITSLWSAHLNAKNTARVTKEELRSIRTKMGEQLHEMKKMLASPGRDGQWSGFLRMHKIPRATADRLVARHQRSLHPDSNLLTEPITEPTEEEVQKIFASVWPKLRRSLPSRQSLLLFIDLLTSQFRFYEATDREILVPEPSTPTICPVSPDGDSIN
jgi:hypothetical protein